VIKLNKILIKKNLSIYKAMEKLQVTALKQLLVVDADNKLLGTITDGDIRRALLNGSKISDKITKIYNKYPIFFYKKNLNINLVNKKLIESKLLFIPLVNNKKIILDLIYQNQTSTPLKKNFKLSPIIVVIMAGGFGKRLLPFTKVLPKPLIPINDKPIIDIIIEKFLKFGFNNFFISLNFKSKIIKSFFSAKKNKFKLQFLEEKKPLGTAGALSLLKNINSKILIISNCDTITNFDYQDMVIFHKKEKNDLTIVASLKKFTVPYGICETDKSGNLSNIHEKPNKYFLINIGIYCIEKKLLKLIPKNRNYSFINLINDAKKNKFKVGIFPVSHKSWNDIGQWEEYKKTVKLYDF
jgi:dTDP-glucose pyrophosphorylase